MHPSLLILLIGLLYILGFSVLSYLRRQGTSNRFIIEGLIITALFSAISFFSPIHLIVFLIIIYLITMRVRLLVDLGSWLTSKNRFGHTLNIYQFALRLWPDAVARQIVLINRGVTELRMGEPEAAFITLEEALANESLVPGAKYQSAGYYNLGLACQRTNREAKAIRHFNEAIDALPNSIYAHAARQALKKRKPNET